MLNSAVAKSFPSQAHLEFLLCRLEEGVLFADANSTCTYLNPSMARILGRSVEDQVGKSLVDLLSGWSSADWESRLAHMRGARSEEVFDLVHPQRGLHVRFVLCPAPEEGLVLRGIELASPMPPQGQESAPLPGRRRAMHADLDAVLEGAPLGVALFDREGRYLRVNSALAAMNGLPEAAHLGRRVREVVPSIAEPTEAILAEVVASGEGVYDVEVRGEFRDPARGTGHAVASYFPWHIDGQVAGVAAMVLDLTERKRMEDALRASEAELRFLADTMPQMVWMTDPEGRGIYFNRVFAESTGIEGDLANEVYWQGVVHPEDREAAESAWQHAVQTRSGYEAEYRIRGRDGVYRWHLARALPQHDERGAVRRWVGTSTDIDTQKKVAAALAASESRLRAFYDATPQLVWMMQPDGSAFEVNRGWLEYFGTSLEVAEASGWQSVIHPEDVEEALERWRHSVATGTPFETEYRLRRHDGVYRWHLGRARPVRDERGEISLWCGICTDIDALRRSEARAKRLQEVGTIGVALWQGERLVGGNDALVKMLGYTHEEFESGAIVWSAITPPEYAELDLRCLEEMARHGFAAPFEKEYLAKDGRRVPVLLSCALWEGSKNSGVAWILDISDRRRVESEREAALALAQGERKRFYDLLLHAPAIINILEGPDHVFAFVNERFVELIPESRAFIGKTLREAQPELVDQGIVERIEKVYRTGEPFVGREVAVTFAHEGTLEERYFTFVYQAIRSASGAIEGVASFAFDVTVPVVARKQVEEFARRAEMARRQAEDASRAKDEFLSTLSHELRTPLNAIVGWSSLLRNGNVRESQRMRALETIERNARVQARLIEDLLDLSRIVQGKLVLSVGPVEMVRVVEAALDSVRPAAEAKGVRLQPVLDSHATLVGDPDRLQQIVWNLLSNAIKFTPKGGRIQVRLRREASYVEVVVADSGQGIAPEFLPHVFDRFRQADSTSTRHFGGLGLGLAIVRSLVELHGGIIEAASDGIDQGATFTLRLPMAPLRADKAPPPASNEVGVPTLQTFECPPGLRGLRVLVVDDEPDTRALLEYLLVQCECQVRTAAHAAEAMALVTSQPFDVLVSDVGMPGENGLSLIARIRALPPERGGNIPALALTAYARSEDRTAALKAGFHMHLTKPIEPGELTVVIETLATRYGRR